MLNSFSPTSLSISLLDSSFLAPLFFPDRYHVDGIKNSGHKDGSLNLSPAADCICYVSTLRELFLFYSLSYISLLHAQPLP